jgi:hypothetical protein
VLEKAPAKSIISQDARNSRTYQMSTATPPIKVNVFDNSFIKKERAHENPGCQIHLCLTAKNLISHFFHPKPSPLKNPLSPQRTIQKTSKDLYCYQ